MNTCPQQAIETSHSMAALMIALTTSLPVSYYLSAFVHKAGLTLGDSAINISGLVLTWLLALTIIYFLYILMFALLRSPLIT